MQGLLLIDKPEGITSFGAVAKVKKLTGVKRVGHTGTLDPMATGVLPILVGRPTVLQSYILNADKEYVASVRLGITTDTLDITGNILEERSVAISEDELKEAANRFLGEIFQTPPMYSAIKKEGVRLYELARKGKEVERAARQVTIKELEIFDFDGQSFKMRVLCSKGTYIRTLADDIGKKLGTGATLTALKRTKTAGFSIKDCVSLEELTSENAQSFLKSSELAVANYKSINVSLKQAVRFSNGGELSSDRVRNYIAKENEIVRVVYNGIFVGLGEFIAQSGVIKPKALVNFINISGEENNLKKKTAIAIGTFDGLHKGHKAVIEGVLLAEHTPIALSFKMPPKFNNANGNLLMTLSEKEATFKEMGIEPYFMEFSQVKDILPNDFLKIVVEKYNPALIAVGSNFRFGKNASGDVTLLSDFCKENGIICKVLEPVTEKSEIISSSKVREYIKNGDISLANGMLGYPFAFEGEIIRGDQRGRTIGFPTINQKYPDELTVPKNGVYLSATEIDGKVYKSLTNIGIRPTFETEKVTSETHILNFSGDLYGKSAKIRLYRFLRAEERFSSLDELKNAIEKDKEQIENLDIDSLF